MLLFRKLFFSFKKQKFRHWDHKFEWTRKEFQDWCQHDILNKFKDYRLVRFDGLGVAPSGYEKFGFCSQFAIFVKNEVKLLHAKRPEPNHYELYLREKINFQIKNAQLTQSTQDEKKTFRPYFDQSEFELESFGYKLFYSIMFPFFSYDFENDYDREQALVRELNHVVFFLTRSYRSFGRTCWHNGAYTNREEVDEANLTEEQREKLENDIDLYEDAVRLASMDKILEFERIKKFKLSKEKIFEVMVANNFEFTKSKKYVLYRVITEDWFRHSSDVDEDDDKYESSSIKESSEPEQWSTENQSSDTPENSNQANSSINQAYNSFEEEDWDSHISKPKVYTAQEQFEDVDEEESGQPREKSKNDSKSRTIYDESPELADNLYKTHYNAKKSKEIYVQLKTKYRRNVREAKKILNHEKYSPNQFDFDIE